MSIAFVQTTIASVAFKGNGLGQITGGEPGVSLTGIASGIATHLGKYTRTENLFFGPNGTFTGDVTFESANGDLLIATTAGAFTSETAAAGTYTFTGGTGRFEGTTGTAYFSVQLLPAGQFTVEFNGSLDK
jgi:hypothetical protein